MHHKLLTIVAVTALFAGCSSWGVGKVGVDYNHKSGQVGFEAKGSKSGNYNENTGLNLGFGDNSIASLIIAACVGCAIVMAYPIQRKLRLGREKRRRARQEAEWEQMRDVTMSRDRLDDGYGPPR